MAILSLKNQLPMLIATAMNRKTRAVDGPPIRYPAPTRMPPRAESRTTVLRVACQLDRPVVVMSVFLLRCEVEVSVEYTKAPKAPIRVGLRLRPSRADIVTMRDYHQTTHRTTGMESGSGRA